MPSNILFDKNAGKVLFSGKVIGKLNYSERLILEYLIAHPNEIASKDELLAVGWPNRMVVPNSLNIAIRNIRNIFEIAGVEDEPETVPKYGFRLSADIIKIADEGAKTLSVEVDMSAPVTESGAPHHISGSVVPHTGTPASPAPPNHTAPLLLRAGRRMIGQIRYGYYVLAASVGAAVMHFYIKAHEPVMACTKVKEATFCGTDPISEQVINIEYQPGDVFWYSEREHEYKFVKVN